MHTGKIILKTNSNESHSNDSKLDYCLKVTNSLAEAANEEAVINREEIIRHSLSLQFSSFEMNVLQTIKNTYSLKLKSDELHYTRRVVCVKNNKFVVQEGPMIDKSFEVKNFYTPAINFIEKNLWPKLIMAMESNNQFFIFDVYNRAAQMEEDFLQQVRSQHCIPAVSCWLFLKLMNYSSRHCFFSVTSALISAMIEKGYYYRCLEEEKDFQQAVNDIKEVNHDYVKEPEHIPFTCAIAFNNFKLADELLSHRVEPKINIDILFSCIDAPKLNIDQHPLYKVFDYIQNILRSNISNNLDHRWILKLIDLEKEDQRNPNILDCWEFLSKYHEEFHSLPVGVNESNRHLIHAYYPKLKLLHQLINTKSFCELYEASNRFFPNTLAKIVESYRGTHLEQYGIEYFSPLQIDNIINREKTNILHEACRLNQKNLLKQINSKKLYDEKMDNKILNHTGYVSPNIQTQNKSLLMMPIHIAASHKSADVVSELHQLGVHCDTVDELKGQTAAHIAVSNGDAQFINELRKLNANFHIPNKKQETAFSQALAANNWGMIVLMLLATKPKHKIQKLDKQKLKNNKDKLFDALMIFLENNHKINKTDCEHLVKSIVEQTNLLGKILTNKKSRLPFFKQPPSFDYIDRLKNLGVQEGRSDKLQLL